MEKTDANTGTNTGTNTKRKKRLHRLPRRYDATMETLKELMASKNERVRLQAALRATEILMEHDRSIERQAIATERAAARKAEAEAGLPVSMEPEEAEPKKETTDEFLARIRRQVENAQTGETNEEHQQ